MTKTFELAVSKAAALPESAQEQLEMLERIDMMSRLRADIEIGLRELDAGMGVEIDMADLLREAHAEHGRS